jgi:hypothetical protein
MLWNVVDEKDEIFSQSQRFGKTEIIINFVVIKAEIVDVITLHA